MRIKQLLAIIILSLPFASIAKEQTVSIGVLAIWGNDIADRMWLPTINYLNKNIPGYRFTFTPLTLQQTSKAVTEKSIDFILTNPGNYIELEAEYGISRLLTLKSIRNETVSSQFGAVIFTGSNRTDINTLSDLKNKSFMGVKETAFGGFQMAWLELKNAGVDPFTDLATLEFSGFPHDKVVYAVLDGLVDAGTVRTATLERMARKKHIDLSKLKIINQKSNDTFPFIHSTALYPEWPFAKLKHTDENLAKTISIALLNLPADSNAAISAKSAGWTVPLDYYPVKDLFQKLHIGPYHKNKPLTYHEVLKTYWWLIVLILLALSPPVVIYVRKLKKHLIATDTKLKHSETEWAQALDFLDEPMYMVDLNDRIIRANRAFYKKIKSTPDKAIGHVVTNFTHPEGEESPCKVCRARKNLTDTVITLEPEDPVNKDNIPMEISVKVIKDKSNNPVGIIQKMRNLTEVRKAEESIRKSELLFKSLLHAIPDPLVVTNSAGIITIVNHQFEIKLGYKKNEIIGKPVETLIPHQFRENHVSLRDGYIKDPKVRSMLELETHLWAECKDSSLIPVEISLSPFNIENESLVVSTIHDISNRIKNETELKRLASFPEHDPIPIIEFERSGTITYANPASISKFPDLKNKGFEHPLFHDIESCFSELEDSKELVRNILLDTETFEQKITYNPDTGLYRVYAWDITKLQHLSQKMAYQASHDALTNLINRREFEYRLDKLIRNISATDKHVMCYMDLDQFKTVNDVCGHIAGDELLKQLASTLQTKIRDTDSLARLGGDEFGLILNNCSLKNAMLLAEEVRKTVEEFRFHWNNKTFKIGISIGLVVIDHSSGTLTDVLSAADTACYIAKEEGRNRLHIYKKDQNAVTRHTDEMNWMHEINQALDENNFILYCQKIASISDSNDTHYEILLRMKKSNGELTLPNSFIPAAERFNLMAKIDKWVIENILKLMNQPEYIQYIFSINLSGQSIGDHDFMQQCLNQIKESNVKPERLCFEITETAMISNLHVAINAVNLLRAHGCSLSLDDFGSGLSSFAYLKNLPADYLKIDGIFIKEMENDPINITIVESIIQIGHKMGLKTIAEFVENDVTIGILKAMDIDYIQGYGIEKPIPITQLIAKP